MSAPDGGPAFPLTASHSTQWMTLRDYFAAKALISVISSPRQWRLKPSGKKSMVYARTSTHYAELAYRVADAMIAERAKS